MPARKGDRLKKMYIRVDGVMKAVKGFQYGKSLIFIDESVYTIARRFMEEYDFEGSLVLEKVKE